VLRSPLSYDWEKVSLVYGCVFGIFVCHELFIYMPSLDRWYRTLCLEARPHRHSGFRERLRWIRIQVLHEQRIVWALSNRGILTPMSRVKCVSIRPYVGGSNQCRFSLQMVKVSLWSSDVINLKKMTLCTVGCTYGWRLKRMGVQAPTAARPNLPSACETFGNGRTIACHVGTRRWHVFLL